MNQELEDERNCCRRAVEQYDRGVARAMWVVLAMCALAIAGVVAALWWTR